MPNGDNPKYVMFSLDNMFDRLWGAPEMAKTVPEATVFYVAKNNNGNAEKYILKKLKEQVEKFGTLDELMIEGHGRSESQGSRFGDNEINIYDLIKGIEKIEKELGKKITNRIVFAGCSTFGELNNNRVGFYREFAKEHNMEIVGSTCIALTPAYTRFVQFTPKGDVRWDKLDSKYFPPGFVHERNWADYHIGHTQEDAEKAIRQDIINEATTLVSFRNMKNSGDYEFDNDRSSVADMWSKSLLKKDDMAAKTDVLLTKDGKGAIIISSDGIIRTRGDVKLHKMAEEEESKDIKSMKKAFKTFFKEGVLSQQDKKEVENQEEGLNSNIDDRKTTDPHLRMVVLDDNKHILLAREDGGYEVIEITPAPPSTSNAAYISPKPPAKGKNK